MTIQFGIWIFFSLLVLPASVWAQDIAQVKKGVVKITAQVDGKNRVGSGVVVKLDEDHVYIVTASHVIEGDQHPNVFFYAAPHRSYRAQVLGLEGGNQAGLAALLVEGKTPSDLVALHLDQNAAVSGGEPITLIGFPQGSMWTVTTGTLSGRKGSAISFSGTADDGNSGGPLLFQNKVVGIVTQVGAKFNTAVPAVVARFALEGWGVRLTDATPHSEETKGSANAPAGSIDYSNFEQVKKAAEGGDPKAMDVLGDMYAKGKGVHENYAEAARWYRRSADAGYPEAFAGMGMLSLVKAMGLARDDESAVRLAHDESKKDEFSRFLNNTQEYSVRNQVELREAIRWLRKGAEEGHSAESQLVLALLTSAGVGVEKDPVQAAKWMRLAATKLPVAQFVMGKFYFNGTGVKQDYTEAIRRFRDAADKNVPQAHTFLGFMYMYGHGVVQDFAEAAKWLRKAVDQNDAKALLGILYFTGQGVPQDFHAAYVLAKETAELGDSTGQYLLGMVFVTGNGVPQNYQEGVKWMQAAARNGHTEAQQVLRSQGINW